MKRAVMAKRGKSGELLVAGELLSQGYDVFLPFVDCGIDLIARVENRFVQIQVKQSKYYPRRGRYWQSIAKETFHKNKGPDVYYIFVLRHEAETNYLIVPSSWIDKNAKHFGGRKEKWHFYFKFEDSKVREVRKSGLDMTKFLNNWDLLRRHPNIV